MSVYRLNLLSALFASAASIAPAPAPTPSPTPSPSPAPAPNPMVPALPSTQLYTPQIPGVTVVGKPSGYTMPAAFTGAVVSQQWYRNKGDGTGPVAIASATGSTYTPVSGDAGYWLSVWVTDAAGNVWRSLEFINQSVPVGNSGVISSASTGYKINAANSIGVRQTVTLYGVSTIRLIDNQHTGFYLDNYMAPGTYAAFTGPTNWQENTLFAVTGGAGDSNTQLYYAVMSPSPHAIIAPSAAPTSTAARPAGNTGNGFYVAANGYVYDPMGVEFRPRGVNQLHWNSVSPGIPNSGANIVRLWIDPRQTDYNAAQITNYISKGIVPMLSLVFSWASFSATCDGTNTINVTSMASGGNAGRIYVGQSLAASTGFAACTVTALGTSTGGIGTVTVSVAQAASGGSPVSVSAVSSGTTGSSNTSMIAAVIDWFCDIAAQYTPYNKYIMLNPGNEWGKIGQDASLTNAKGGASADSTWRDAWIAGIPRLRAAGYTCPIVIDAPGSGQDGGNAWTFLNHGPAVMGADSFQNLIFSDHLYGTYFPGQVTAVLAEMAANRTTYGQSFIIGEFAQGFVNVDSATFYTGLEVMGACEAYNIGWLPWVWDSSFHGSAPSADVSTLAMVYDYQAGYSTSNSADLTLWGKVAVEDPVYGLKNIAVKATTGSFA